MQAPAGWALAGNFAPVPDELDVLDLPIEGTLPTGLEGSLLRVGPNPVAPDPADYHWFLGDGMVHAIELRDGRASYRNRWIRTDAAAVSLGEPAIPGQPEPANLISSAANTSLVDHDGRILALYEVSLPTEITVELQTVGRFDYGGELRSPMTAHPKVDPVTGEMLFFGADPFGPPYLRFHAVDTGGGLVRTHDIELPAPVMMHDFAITETRAVFLDLPVVYDFALVGERALPAKWNPANGARVGVMPRDAGTPVRWYEIEPCFVFHTLNAYDDGDRIVLDVVRHDKVFDRDPDGLREGGVPTLERWTIDPGTDRVDQAVIDDRGMEFPRVDPRTVGREHRYAYGTLLPSSAEAVPLTGGLVQHDLQKGTAQRADLGAGAAASEGIFVPAESGGSEDDGWVLAVVYDAERDSSELVVLDAVDFAAEPVARVALPRRVPFHFHGTWVPAR